MSETKNTFEIQLHDSTKNTTAVMVYSIDTEQPSNTLINPTISASYNTIGDLKILRGSFKATADLGLSQPYGISISIAFNKPVYTSIPQVFTQVVVEDQDTLTNSISTQVLNKTLNGFSVNLTNTVNDYPTGDEIQIDFFCVGV